ncbi:MAG TPA: PEP-CTERM sorting domain-containing protein [Bryobacteraceae bacterium]|jgi:hypothetical protein|nr:PEP-CTERM sorting domain-containing protein [Bryobacteraceae bacterium]
MKKRFSHRSKVLSAAAAVFGALFLFAPRVRADIFKIEGPGDCPGNIGAGLCNGNDPFSLVSFLSGAITFQPNNGTSEWVLINDTGHLVTSFSFAFNGFNGNNAVANNATCQIANSHAVTVMNDWLNGCSIVDSLGQTTHLGGAQINNMTPPATITFTGPGIPIGARFNLDFVSMQGQGIASTVPEPSTVTLLGIGLALVGLSVRKRRSA